MSEQNQIVEITRNQDGLYDIKISGWHGSRVDAQSIIDIYEFAMRNIRQLEADAKQEHASHSPLLRACPSCGQLYEAAVLDAGWKCLCTR